LIAWLAEFILESAGAVLCFRRVSCGASEGCVGWNGSSAPVNQRHDDGLIRPKGALKTPPAGIQSLGFYLAFRALADIGTFLILFTFGPDAYGLAAWIGHFGQYALLCWLCCSLVARMMGERRYGAYAAILAILLALGVVCGSGIGETLKERLLDGGILADSFLGQILLVGLMSKKVNLDRQLTLIAWGVCLHLGWDGLVVGLAHFWLGALAWLPVGAIAALGVFLGAVWGRRQEKWAPLGEIRASLPPRTPVMGWLDESSKMEC
jgi:hypothetical protein